MKKIFFTALAAIGFFVTNAQNGRGAYDGPGSNSNNKRKCENCEVSQTPNGQVKPVHAQYQLSLGLHKIICVTPKNGGFLSGRINSADELNHGGVVLDGNGDGKITFTVDANVLTNVSFVGGPVVYVGAGAGSGVNPFWQKVSSSDRDVIVGSVASNWFQLGTLLNGVSISAGADNEFDIYAAGVANWTTPPGIYEQTNFVVVSAP